VVRRTEARAECTRVPPEVPLPAEAHNPQRAVVAALRQLGLYTHAEAVGNDNPHPEHLRAAGRALLDVEAAFAAAGVEAWAAAAAKTAALIRRIACD